MKKPNTEKSGRKTGSAANAGEGLAVEIILWVLLAVSILLFLSNFNLAGTAGKAVGFAVKGLFGVMAYPFPFVLFFGISFVLANRESGGRWKLILGIVMLFLFLCSFFQLVLAGYKSSLPVGSYYTAAKNGAIAGGLAGGLIVMLFAKPFGIVGAYILTLTGLIIAVVILVRKPLMVYMQRRSASAIRRAGRQRKIRREEKREERKKPQLWFREPAVSDDDTNVDFDLHRLLGLDRDKSNRFPEDEEIRYTIRDKSRPSQDAVKDSGAERKPVRPRIEMNRPQPEEKYTDEKDSGNTSGKKSASSKRTSSAGKDRPAAEEVEISLAQEEKKGYRLPDISLLTPLSQEGGDSEEHILNTAEKLEETLRDFGVNVNITNVSRGPAVTRYELQPEHGVKVAKITGLIDDIKLSLAAADIRIEAPIPGKSAIGIEVPNKENSIVPLRDLIDSREFRSFRSKLAFAVGKDIGGNAVIADIKKMPHLLIAGATGSGKSVCINTLIMSVLFKATPEEVRMIMIDPKVIELSVYNGIPHLLLPVVTDPKKAAGALNWAVQEMERRYKAFAECGVGIRDLGSYNMHIRKKRNSPDITDEEKEKLKEMPQILIIVDELADLMMVAPGDVEQSICRLTQLARAAGLHLVVATQRPSVNVITGLIKANMPSRIAFSVSSGVDSRTILDMNGAERLIGKGDMLFYPQGYVKPARVQGSFVPEEDVSAVVDFLTKESDGSAYSEDLAKEIENSAPGTAAAPSPQDGDDRDELFWDAGECIIDKEKASIGMLQRVLKIGFNRAARIMDQLCEAGVVGEEEGTKPRKILMTMEEFHALRDGDA
ncbi:MAG: DNA translocase FtsK [Lachnospiraceae bacterium]|nr:DNA translocase FtsK [Lachnospiraceae bacterium]